MALTKERAEVLASYLTADKERAEELLKLSPEEAIQKINADGNNFTMEEVKEFGTTLASVAKKMSENSEMNENDLEEVAGGLTNNQLYAIGEVCRGVGTIILVAQFALW